MVGLGTLNVLRKLETGHLSEIQSLSSMSVNSVSYCPVGPVSFIVAVAYERSNVMEALGRLKKNEGESDTSKGLVIRAVPNSAGKIHEQSTVDIFVEKVMKFLKTGRMLGMD